MMGSLSGFSSWLLNSDNFNPFSGIPITVHRLREQRQTSESAMFDDWFGTAQIDGEELSFTTNCDRLEPKTEYYVVYERTEIPTGEAGIRIHDVIS